MGEERIRSDKDGAKGQDELLDSELEQVSGGVEESKKTTMEEKQKSPLT